MQERIGSINPTFWFLSRNQRLLDMIKSSNMVHSSARTMIPETFFEVKTVATAAEVYLQEGDRAIEIVPENIYQEWLAIINSNRMIGVLKEEKLVSHLLNGEDDAIYEKIYEAMRNLA